MRKLDTLEACCAELWRVAEAIEEIGRGEERLQQIQFGIEGFADGLAEILWELDHPRDDYPDTLAEKYDEPN